MIKLKYDNYANMQCPDNSIYLQLYKTVFISIQVLVSNESSL